MNFLQPTTTAFIEAEVTKQLNSLVTNNEMFTVFDVTRALRSAFPTRYIGHYEVKDLIHSMYDKELPPFENGVDYIREDYNFIRNGSPVYCQIFRPAGSDITTYDPDRPIPQGNGSFHVPSKANGQVNTSPSGIGNSLNNPSNTTKDSANIYSLRTDKRSRVTITAALLRAIGIKAKGYAFIHTLPDKSLAISKPHFSDSPLTLVDKDCNIRLSKTFIKSKGVGPLTSAFVKNSTIICK